MRNKTRAAILCAALLFLLCGALPVAQGAAPAQAASYNQQIGDGILDAVVTILVADGGQAQAVGSGLVVRGDGLILTAYHLVKGARTVAIKLRNGETFDRAELIAADERRNIAIMRIPAVGLSALPGAVTEESWVGATVVVVSNVTSGTESMPAGILSSVSLADEIPGAGKGYRVLKFTAPVAPNAVGGVLVDDRGRVLGLITALPQAQGQNYAVPMSSVLGLVRAVGGQLAPATLAAHAAPTPAPIPQSQVSVPQRPVSRLEARGPGSVVVKPARPVDALLASKTIYVTSRTTFFKPEQLINELQKRAELNTWGLAFVDDVQVADLVLTLDHVVFTYKFTFTLAHQRTGVIVATGSRIIWDGNLGATDMAVRVIEKLTQVRAQAATKAAQADEQQDKKGNKDHEEK